MSSMGYRAAEFAIETCHELMVCPPQFLYLSAEQAMTKEFQDILKNESSSLYKNLAAVVVDESHIVETWTGKRKVKGKLQIPFRDAYGKLSILRSLCKEEIPLLALTGTADSTTQCTIICELAMKTPKVLFVSPNRQNLRFSISKVAKEEMLSRLDWIIHMVKVHGINTPKTIIFCNTLYAVASVVNYIVMKLGNAAFHPSESKKREHCLIGIFHSLTQTQFKERVFNSFKTQGIKRVVVATSALSMGVNFPDLRYVCLWGATRSLLDLHQQAGRAGRDGKPADVVISYYGQQLSHCDDNTKHFLRATDCFRVAGYKSFDPNITPLQPPHACCNYCASQCTCSNGVCSQPKQAFESETVSDVHIPVNLRTVTDEDKTDLRNALYEVRESLTSGRSMIVFGVDSSHGFSSELIEDVVENCHKLFCIKDLLRYLPVFSLDHAQRILEIISETFCDIEEINDFASVDESMELHLNTQIEEILASEYIVGDCNEFSLKILISN